PSNRTRLPCELGERRPAPRTTPALTSSSLNFWYSAIASGVGGAAASVCAPSFASTSTRISVSFIGSAAHRSWLGLFLRPHPYIERRAAYSTFSCVGLRSQPEVRGPQRCERPRLSEPTGRLELPTGGLRNRCPTW